MRRTGGAMQDRMTRRNPNNGTYRVWLDKAGTFRIESQGGVVFAFGDLVDRLGRYEDIAPLEELEKTKK